MANILATGRQSFLGFGLVQPFRRIGGADFQVAGGVELVAGCVRQIIGTDPGEVRWRPSFGFEAEKYRHKNMNPGLEELAQVKTLDAIGTWEPRVSAATAEVERLQDQQKLRIRMRC